MTLTGVFRPNYNIIIMKFIINIIIALLFLPFIDYFNYKAINSAFNNILSNNIFAKLIFLASVIIVFLLIAIALLRMGNTQRAFIPNLYYPIFTLIILLYIPKINIEFFYFLEKISLLLFKKHLFLNYIGIGISAILFLFILHGITINKTNFRLRKQIISSSKIPASFRGFKIIQISDLHIGSFHNNIDAVKKIVEITNAEEADLILFTGDMISNYAEEMDEFILELKKLSAKNGKYAILGNHDYSDYVRWKTKKDKQENLLKLKQKTAEIGFVLLNNQSINIEKNKDTIQLIGVENWGLPPFPQHGKLTTAIKGLDKNKFTILMSHDPSHWRAEVLKLPFIDLTLSGHTHAMQFGIEIGSWQFSPIILKYKEWGGLYKSKKQSLYVNRGAGFIGFQGRVGIRPEITLFVFEK